MNSRMELAQRIVEVAERCSHDAHMLQEKVLGLLRAYKVESPAENSKGNLPECIRRFIGAKRIEGLSPKTLANYQLYLGKFAEAVHKDAARISADDIRAYVGGLRMQESSLQTIMATLRSFFGWLTREELIRKNPMNKIPAPKATHKRLRRALNIESLERLRNACETVREKALLEFLYSTGCRVSELCGVRMQDVDFSARCVQVRGKGGQERLVYFSVKASLLLQEYIGKRPSGGALFCNGRAPYGAISVRSVQKLLKGLGERAKLQERVHPHLLRHTFATLTLNAGMSITAIQKLMGHRQLSTTQIYASISMDNVRHEHNRFVA